MIEIAAQRKCSEESPQLKLTDGQAHWDPFLEQRGTLVAASPPNGAIRPENCRDTTEITSEVAGAATGRRCRSVI